MKHNYLACMLKWMFEHSDQIWTSFLSILIIEIMCNFGAFAEWFDSANKISYLKILLILHLCLGAVVIVSLAFYLLIKIFVALWVRVNDWFSHILFKIEIWAQRNC